MAGSPDTGSTSLQAILNHPPSRLPGPQLLHELVQQHGADENAALEFLSSDGRRETLSYAQLHEQSEALAAKITALAALTPLTQSHHQEDQVDQLVVPILAPQRPSLYVALLAILKAGGAFCPLNLDAPPERVKFILGDVAARIVITTAELAPAIPQDGSYTVLVLDDQDDQRSSSPAIHRLPRPTDLAYVMYTSGSTGTPKGVGVSHDAAAQSLLAHDRHIPAFSRFLQFAAPTFDVSVFEIFFPLFRGSTLVSCDRAVMLNDLPAAITRMEVDACELTPTVAGSLLRKRQNAPCLKLLLTIGEMLTEPVVREFGGSEELPSMLWAMYGPTEATIHCSLQPAFSGTSSVGNIGIPLDTVSAFILRIPDDPKADSTAEVLTVGEVGELAVGGYQLASGYLNRPEQTAAAFVKSQYGPLYRTGDKARLLPDGTLECLGRISGGQVKLRGQRLELGEVEQAALRTPDCHGAVAAVIGGILVLFCAVDRVEPNNEMEDEVQKNCERWLPRFMVPGDVVTMQDFPRLPSGKVDRKQLVSDYTSRHEKEQQRETEFKDALEEQLCQVVGKVLGTNVRPTTNLAAAGLDSLLSIKLASSLRQTGIELGAVDVLKSRTISQLHTLINKQRQGTVDPPSTTGVSLTTFDSKDIDTIPILRDHLDNIEVASPCTPLQSSMLAETASDPRAYCNWVELSLPGCPDDSTLCSWITELATGNEILRTGFVFREGKFTQIVWRDVSQIPIEAVSKLEDLARDFSIVTEEDFLHPLRVQLCTGLSESRILLQIHHALYDGWTIDLILADLTTLSTKGRLEPRPKYQAVVNHAHSTLSSHNSDAARSFWAEYLAGFQSVPFPKLLAAIPKQPRTETQMMRLDVDPHAARRILREIECSPQVLFQAALAWLWSSYAGQDDIVIGCVTSGRTIPVSGIEDIMGPCIASVPSRTNLSQARTMRDLVARIQAGNRTVLNHSSLPLGEIKRSAGMLPGQSLYDVLFVYQESLFSRPEDARDSVREVAHQDYLETKFLVEVEPQQGYYDCRFTYHTDALSDAIVTAIGDELQHVTQHILANIDAEISSLRAAFSSRSLSTYNLNPQSLSGAPDLAISVEAVALQSPDKVAVCFAKRITDEYIDDESVTYQQLNSLGNKIARNIRSSGCSTGDVVAIVMEKSVLLYAGILGIVKAGCSYLPLLPSTPKARIEAILAQSDAKLCLTDTSSQEALAGLSAIRFLNLEDREFETFDDTNLEIPADGSRVANIIYTSGSTGVPKGVCVTQLNITSNLDVLSRLYPVKEDSALLQSCSQAFDVSVFEIFFAWTRGMRLCSASNDTLFEDLERSIRKLGVTHLSMTPTVASLVNPRNVPNVEFLVTSGEPMTEKVAKAWGKQLYQGYGPSETTNICTVKKMGLGEGEAIQHLGFSFGNTSTIVLYQDSTEVVPRGCVGELCFGGDQVAQGYLKMPDLTGSKFINHPDFGRLYRSGDLGRMLPDGSLMIIGRVDDQVKLRGQRIELNEINTVVRESDVASDCVTMLLKRNDSSPDQLVSFYVLATSDDNTSLSHTPEMLPLNDHIVGVTESLYRLLSAKVPTYMVPSHLIPLSKIPVTASGKLDRARLRSNFQELEQTYLESTSAKVEATQDDEQWTEVDRTVARIVSSCLSVPEGSLARWTPLVSFGLDSISAIGLSKELQKQLGCRVPVSLVLQNPCVARLAQKINEQSSSAASHENIALDIFSDQLIGTIRTKSENLGRTVEKVLPCTPLQEAMLAASVTGKSYINNMLFRVRADQDAMKEYWLAMCERHGILRTCFASTDDHRHAFAQIVFAAWQPQWLHLSESHGDLDNCVSRHLSSLGEIVDSMEPPVSFAFIVQEDDVYLSFVCHHALYDGIAIERLLFEVEQLASGASLEPPPAVEPFLREMLAGSSSSDEFWSEQLRDFTPSLLPRAKSSAGDLSQSHAVHNALLDMPLSIIQQRMKASGCSLLSLCQATWASVLATMLQVDDVCFGNVMSCRSAAIDRIDELVAPCFNTVPVRMNLGNTRQNSDLIRSFNDLNPDIIQHQFASLRRIQSLISSQHSQSLFDTLLLLQHPARHLNDEIWSLERDDGEMDIPLVCEFIPSIERDQLSVKLHYERSLISDALIHVVSDILQYCMSYMINYYYSQIPTSASLPSSLTDALSELVVRQTPSTVVDTPPDSQSEEWSDVESCIRATLAKLSSASERSIKRHTTIYQLGLDSISAVQIASLLRKEGMNLSASDVIEQKTCANLARKALASTAASNTNGVRGYDFSRFQQHVDSHLAGHGITPAYVETTLLCTSLQAGMLVQFLQSGGQDYFNFIDFQVDDKVGLEDLQSAWTVLADTHAILRTGFVPVEHRDSSFAMVQYRAGTTQARVSVLQGEPALRFGVEKWRLDTANETAKQLQAPLWRVVCVSDGGKLMMYLAIHHALYDAQSLQTLLQDLARVLQGEKLSHPSSIGEAVRDIAEQERDLQSREEFWKQKSDEVVINFFPTLTPLREESRAVVVESICSKHRFTAFDTSIRDSGLTMQAAVQATWTRVLSSYLGESSVTFGVVLSGRNSEVTKDVVFPCISTLPVISRNLPSNRELLQSMLDYSGQLYKQQHTPLTRIQRWLGYPDSRLFDTLLVYQKMPHGSEAQLPFRVVEDHAVVDYPLSIEVEPGQDDRLVYRGTFFSDIIPREHAKILLEQFDAVLSHLAFYPDAQESELFSLTPSLFSVTPPEEPELPAPERFLHQLVESQVRNIPDKTALHFVDSFEGAKPVGKAWSYRALDGNGNRVASMLLPHTTTGDIVAVYFDKCPEVFFVILGILKAGCAFVALDPGAPSSRKEFIMKDSGASVLLTSKENASTLDFQVDATVLAIDETTISQQQSDPVVLARELTPQDVCYCLYTSGTTGTPKGCEITHENAVQAMLAFQKVFAGHWDETSKWLQFASFHFDVAVLEQYWSWSVGITLVGAPRDLILEDLAGTISRLEITHIDLTPSLARLLHPDDVPSLTRGVFITGGEQLKQEILDSWGSKAVIYNAYGPTEATIGVTTYPRVPRNGRSSNIGKQFVNVGSYVLKPGTEVPVFRGGVGELCVSGKLVGKGYLNRQDLTTERFPVLEQFDERVYRTGDLVRILHDGCFEFLGRADDQVKLRGQRLELGEINHTIRTGVPEVHDVATLVMRNEKQRKDILVSFVAVETGTNKTQESLQIILDQDAPKLSKRVQDACRAKLPGYMVPTYIFCLPFMPLSSNNKAETRKLKDLFNDLDAKQLMALTNSVNGSLAQLDETGQEIFRILSTVEKVDLQDVTPNTSVFELGVDSISVIRFSTALKRAGFGHATPAIILKNPKLGDLANAISSKDDTVIEDNTAAARQLVQACYHRHRTQVERELHVRFEDIEYIAPCSPLQEGMITRSKLPATEGAYFNMFRYELADEVSASRLKEAWITLVETCPVLRTRFIETSDGHIQVASKSASLPWNECTFEPEDKHDLEGFLNGRHEAWLKANEENITQPLNILLLQLGNGRRLFVVHIFHALYDAQSMELMMNKVQASYRQLEDTSSAPSYLDALIHGPLRSYGASKQFWVDHLASASYEPLHSICRQVSDGDINCTRQISVPGLETLRISLGTTHQAVLQAVWVSVAQQFLESITIGVVISGRSIDLPGVDEVIGPLFNTIPFHSSIAEAETWASLVRKCHDFNVSILPFQHVPLRDVQKWCAGGKPLFDTLFSFQRVEAGKQPSSGQELWTLLESPLNADYPLAFEATLTPNGELQLQLVAQAGIANYDALSDILDQVEGALQAILSPDQPIGRKGYTQINGYAAQNGTGPHPGSPGSSKFTWTDTAYRIRDEIAQLAEVPAESIDEHTSLLELGLDSIDMIKLSSRLQKRGITIKMTQLMRDQKISVMVNQPGIQRQHDNKAICNGTSNEQDVSKLLRNYLLDNGQSLDQVEDVLPVTPLQDSMVAEMIQSDFHRYFNHDVLALDSDIDLNRLRESWAVVVANSPILRTTFVEVEDPNIDAAYCQLVSRSSPLAIDEIDLPSQDDFSQITEAARQRAVKERGLSGLLQLVIATKNGSRYLVLSIAHALYDGWSLSLLHQDVRAAYHDSYVARPEYKEYLQHVVTTSTTEAKQFWSGFLAGADPTLVPAKESVVENTAEEVHRMEAASTISSDGIKAFCKQHALSTQVLGQACWAAILAARTRSLDVTFGVVLSGRDTEEAEELMFPTMNTVAVRSVLYGSVRSWLLYMQENMTSIRTFQQYPLREAQKAAGNTTGPLFNSLFIQQIAVDSASQDGKPLMVSVEGSSAVEYPVCVEVEISGELVTWRTACSSNYLSRKETAMLLHQLDAVLGFLINSPSTDVLRFTGQEVSVCGLPSFDLREKESSKEQPVMTNGVGKPRELTATEKEVCSVLSEVSGVPVESIDRNHSVYHLGLDSISVIKVSSLLRKRGIVVSARQMLGAKSISALADTATSPATVNGREDGHGDETAPLLQTIDSAALLTAAKIDGLAIEKVLPATAMQVHMLSVWQNTSGAVFHAQFSYSLRGAAGLENIASAWLAMVEHYPILRTSFLATASTSLPFVQVVHRYSPDMARTTIDDGTWNCSIAVGPLGPLISLCVSPVGKTSWHLGLHIHHALYDGVSLPIMMDTFQQLCQGVQPRASDVSSALWTNSLSFAVSDATRAARRSFWTEYLHGAKTTHIAKRPPASSLQDGRTSLLRRSAVSNIGHLQLACSNAGVSLQVLFFAAYAKFLASKSDNEGGDVLFGIYLANRTSADGLDRLPYPTLSLVPLRVRQPEALDIMALAKAIQHDVHQISSPENASVGLWEILDWAGVTVTSFVNFLSLPGGGKNDEGTVVLEDVVWNDASPVKRQMNATGFADAHPSLAGNLVTDAYPDSVDVEVSVAGGTMDVGIFGSADTIDAAAAKEAILAIVDTFTTDV